MSSDSGNSTSKGSPPAVFDIPTLGRAVRLSELYDARSGKFLGIQLYPQDQVKCLETNIRHTELTVSLSTTHQQKATLLDINAKLSLDVLGGLVKVTGSASYLNDEKSNTNEYAYALALKMRLKEQRILFAEDDLGRNVLRVAEKDYINRKLATHFVSSIVYGGNYIVNLVAKQTEMTKEEKVEGKLQASFDKLKGAISLSGSVDARIKGRFKDMDDKFNLVVHGDVALDKVPITPKDVLDTFADAASLIADGGGVPISATLQPIPPDLYKAGLIFKIEDDIVDLVLEAFSGLDDLRSRFLVLQDSAKRLRDFVPKLARAIRAATSTYIGEHSKLLHQLAEFLQDHKLGKKTDHAPLLADVNTLYHQHVPPDDDSSEPSEDELKASRESLILSDRKPTQILKYPSTLVGLEDELSRIQYLIADIRRVRESLNPHKLIDTEGSAEENKPIYRSFYLSSLEDVCRFIRTQSKTPLFIMPRISGNVKYNLLSLEYLAIVREYSGYFEDSVNIAHMFYAENPKDVYRKLGSGEGYPKFDAPSVVIAEVSKKGKLTWDLSPPSQDSSGHPAESAFALSHKPDLQDIGTVALGIDAVDSKKDFTFQIRAKEGSDPTKPGAILSLRVYDTKSFLLFSKGFWVNYCGLAIKSAVGKKPDPGEEFLGTFVQDIKNQRWILYLDGDEIASEPLVKEEGLPNGKFQVVYWGGISWWDGELLGFKAFACAFTKEQVKNSYLGWKGQN